MLTLFKNNLFLLVKVLSENNTYLVPTVSGHGLGTTYKAVNKKDIVPVLNYLRDMKNKWQKQNP